MSAPRSSTLKTTRHCPTPRPLPHRHSLIRDISHHLSCAMTSFCSLLVRPTDSFLGLSSPADFWPLYLHLYPTCLLCRKGSCCICTQNIYFGVTNSPIANYSCRNGSLPTLACIYYHCKQQHWTEPLNRRLLVICYQKWPHGTTLTQLVEFEILRWFTCP